MENPSRSEQSAVSTSTIRDDNIDIVFINDLGNISVGNSLRYGETTPASSIRSTLSSRSPTGAHEQPARRTAHSALSGTSAHGSQHQTTPTLAASNSIARSNVAPEVSLISSQFQVIPENPIAHSPRDSHFTMIWLDRFYEVKPAPQSEGKDGLDSESNDESESEDDDLPEPEPESSDHSETPTSKKNIKDFPRMDDCYVQILWRNIIECESRYESRCRTCENDHGVCFLKFHTVQPPYLNESNFILALVHHVKIPKTPNGNYGAPEEHIFAFVLGLSVKDIGKLFISLRKYWEITSRKNKEVGLTTRLFLAAVLNIYGFREAQSAILNSFGKLEDVGKQLRKMRKTLKGEVKSNKEKARNEEAGKNVKLTGEEEIKLKKKSFERQMEDCTSLNLKLMKMDKALPGVRSRVHFVGLCAKGLLRDQSQIQEYIREYFSPLEVENARDKVLDNANQQHPAETPLDVENASDAVLVDVSQQQSADPSLEVKNASNTVLDNVNQQHPANPAKPALQFSKTGANETAVERGKSVESIINALSTIRYKRRDDDKLDMIDRSMQQFEIDIKSLKARTNIAIGLVATEHARSQGSFQSLVIQATEQDGSIMRIIATITVLLLPATFLALLITTPMIQWAKPVVQLASDTPDSIVDKGKPVFVYIPLFLWLGLSIFFSLCLGAWLNAKKEEKNIFAWLIEKVIPSQAMEWVSSFRKARQVQDPPPPQNPSRIPHQWPIRFLNPGHPSKTLLVERGEQDSPEDRTQASCSVSPPTIGRNPAELIVPTNPVPRMSGESTLGSDSIADLIEET